MIHGASLHRELGLLEQAGLPPLELLRAPTLYPARFLADSADPPFGVIAAGKAADLVLVRQDPLQTPGALADIELVMLAGRILRRQPVPPPPPKP